MSGEGELMMTILASYAQEESLSASENQKWRIRKGFENGELLNWRFLFGYRISKGGINIDNETAPIVREVFARVIAGESFGAICKDLNTRGFTCALSGKWCAQRIREMIANEKYVGNAMLSRTEPSRCEISVYKGKASKSNPHKSAENALFTGFFECKTRTLTSILTVSILAFLYEM